MNSLKNEKPSQSKVFDRFEKEEEDEEKGERKKKERSSDISLNVMLSFLVDRSGGLCQAGNKIFPPSVFNFHDFMR